MPIGGTFGPAASLSTADSLDGAGSKYWGDVSDQDLWDHVVALGCGPGSVACGSLGLRSPVADGGDAGVANGRRVRRSP